MNITFENTTLIGDEYGGNFTNLTTLTPTTTSHEDSSLNGLIVGASIMACIGLAATCFMMIPYIVEYLHNNQISDVERNNRYNAWIMSQNPKYKKKIEIVQLVEVVVADPFDATETCSICLEELGEGESLGSLPCGHKHFHKKCIDEWMQISNNNSCPICRSIVV